LYLKAKVLKVEVKKNPGFHEKTGDPDPSYFLEATVVDADTSERYQCSFRESLGAELLYKAYSNKIPEAERDTLAADVEAKAKQRLENQEVTLIVDDIRVNKGFITLLVRLRRPPDADEH
jgi:hypothetical protein